VLLAGAGLFVRSLRNVASADIGYDADRLVLASVWWDRKLGNYDLQITQGLPVIAGQLARVPGVERVSLVDEAPFEGFGPSRVYLPGKDTIPGLNGMLPMRSVVSAEFFETAGVHVLKGRGFSADDRIGQELVAAVSGLMAKKFWPAEDPLGKCIIIGKRTDPCRRVVGVVSETHYTRILEEPSMHVYVPLAQSPEVTPHAVVIRVAPGRRDGVYARARALLESLGPWANLRIESMTGILAPELRPWRVGAGLVSAAGLLALVVAIVGVYSSISYTVSQRRHEMGVRAALGARAPAIMRLVIGQGVRVVTVGVVCGVGIALALGKLLASLLYGVTPHDPAVLAVASLVLIVVAAGASAVPAWRSTRVDPVEALRAE
jgi:predicted permease